MLCIGYTTKVGFPEYVTGSKAPKNYKDAFKIATYEAESQANAMAEAADSPLTGVIDQVVVLKVDGMCFHHEWGSEPSLLTLLEILPATEETIYVFRASRFLKLAIHQHLDVRKKPLTKEMLWAVRSDITSYPFLCCGGRKPTQVVDPLRVLLGSQADSVSLETVVMRYGLAPIAHPDKPYAADLAGLTLDLARLLEE